MLAVRSPGSWTRSRMDPPGPQLPHSVMTEGKIVALLKGHASRRRIEDASQEMPHAKSAYKKC